MLGYLQMKKYREESNGRKETRTKEQRRHLAFGNGGEWCVYMDNQLYTFACLCASTGLCVKQLNADGQYVSFFSPAPCRPPYLDAS